MAAKARSHFTSLHYLGVIPRALHGHRAEELELALGAPLGQRFDLICNVRGGLSAMGLAAEIPASELGEDFHRAW